MSKDALLKTLRQVQREIRKNSDVYRELVSNKKSHIFSLSYEEFSKEIKNNPIIADALSQESFNIDSHIRSFFDHLKIEVKNLENGNPVFVFSDIEISENFFSVTIAAAPKYSPGIFEKIKRIKKTAQKNSNFVDNVNKDIEKLTSKKYKKIFADKLLDVTHSDEAAVSRQRKLILQDALFNFKKVTKSKNAAAFLDFISEQLVLEIKKSPKLDTVRVSLGDAYQNRLKGATTEKKFASITGSLSKDLKLAIEALKAETWVNAKGSSSFREIKEAEIINPLAMVKGPRVRNSIKKQKVNLQSNSAKVEEKKPKVSAAAIPQDRVAKAQRIRRTPTPTSIQMDLIGILNQRLPETVQKNMGAPALEYRTGRFANSVQVTDIISTRQGFPSIGYTYMKSPYQTFEKGFAQGSPDRDPRKIIDTSIREIAAAYAIGRFYTRRT